MRCLGMPLKEELKVDADTLVRDYLGRLEAAAWQLAAERRVELASEVREHIETALAESDRRDEITVRNVLERLGPPEEIVAAEAEPSAATTSWGSAQPTARTAAHLRWGAVEISALLLLTVGAVFVPFFGPLLGLAFVWLSAVWTTRQKLVATGIAVALMLLLPILFLLSVGAG